MPGMAALVDTVRNRLLEFALEIQGEIGETEIPLEQITPESVEKAVTTIIYGGHNVVAGKIAGDVQQIGEFNVLQGDFHSLARALEEVGVPVDEIDALERAIAEDKEAGEGKGFGGRTSEWLGKALTYVGKGDGSWSRRSSCSRSDSRRKSATRSTGSCTGCTSPSSRWSCGSAG